MGTWSASTGETLPGMSPCFHKGPTQCEKDDMRCCACVAGNHLAPIHRVVPAGETPLPGWLPHDNANLYCWKCRDFWDSHLQISRLPTFESTMNGAQSVQSPYVTISYTANPGVPNTRERFGPPLTSRPPPPWSTQRWAHAPPMERGPRHPAAYPPTDSTSPAPANPSTNHVSSIAPDVALRFAIMVMMNCLNDAAARFAATFAADHTRGTAMAVSAAAAVQEEQRSLYPGLACEACGHRNKHAMNYPCMHVSMCAPCSLLAYPRTDGQSEVPADPNAVCTKCNETVSHIVCSCRLSSLALMILVYA